MLKNGKEKESVDMTLRELEQYMECPRKYEIGRLHIGEQSRYGYWELAIQNMCGMLEKEESISQIKKRTLLFLQENYQRSWFQLPWQKDEAARQDASCFFRYLDTFSYDQIQEVKSNQTMRIAVKRKFEDRYVDNILLRIHLVLTYKNGEHEGIIFNRKFARRYTYHAKLEAHKPQSSPELMAMLYALREHADLRVTQIQMAGEDERAGYPEKYEKHADANRISICAKNSQWSEKEIYEKFLGNIAIIPKSICKKCLNESACKISGKIYLEKESIAKENKEMCFSKEQEAVIHRCEGSIRVSAGPGSGKTAVIAGRVKEMIHAGIPADKIVVLTYTREAVKELIGRMETGNTVQVCTIHSLAYQMLLEHQDCVGKKRLAEPLDKKLLLLRVLKHAPKLMGVSYEGMEHRYGLLQMLLNDFSFIERHGEARFRETQRKKDVEGILRIKDFFDASFHGGGYISYDEQISEAIALLLENPNILKKEQQKHPYILIDEAQDLDAEQVTLIRLLTGSTGNIMIVGDDDQAVFGFRGGSNQFMLHFKEIYPMAEDMLLGSNYRSSEEIVTAANALIHNNQNRIPKKMVSACGKSGIPCTHIEVFSDRQITILLCKVKEYLGCGWKDIAVIAKNNKDLYRLCDILESYNKQAYKSSRIPYEKPKYYLREDAVFCGIFDLLSLATKGMDQDLHLFRLLANLDVTHVEKEDRKKSLYQDLLDRRLIYSLEEDELLYYMVTQEDPLILQAFSKISRAKAVLNLPEIRKGIRLAAVNLFRGQSLDYEPVLEGIDDLIREKRIKNIAELQALLEMIWFFGDSARIRYSGGKEQVRFLTAHDAKGQQFQAVFVYAIDLFETGNEEEDRRLLYVAMTRAEKCLITSELLKGKSNFLRDFMDHVTIRR